MNSIHHILSAGQFSHADLVSLFTRAEEMEQIIHQGKTDLATGKILATLFYEPSTRTRLSFETAMHRLGGSVISETDVHFSSITKGEVLEDTIRIIGGYSDVIAIRSSQSGDAKRSAEISPVPIINAGDGSAEHPTQALLDIYTIHKNFREKMGKESLKIFFVGDLKYGRTVHSLQKIIRQFEGFEISYVAPEALQIPDEYLQSTDHKIFNLTDEVFQQADIIYDTRIQSERFESREEYEKWKNVFVIDPSKVQQMKSDAILLHPLPRVNEITQAVDALPQAQYFHQAQNGVPIRMALIANALNI